MTQTRTPAGVPTGGQFAASAKGEASVALDPTSPAAEAAAKLAKRIENIANSAARLADIAHLVAARDEARAEFGDEARFLQPVDGQTDDYESYTEFNVLDDDGEEMGVVRGTYADISGQPLPADWFTATGETFDLAALDVVDLERETRVVETALTHQYLDEHALDYAIADREAVIETAYFSSNYPEGGLTEEQIDAIEVEVSDFQFPDNVMSDFHYKVDSAVGRVVERTQKD